MEEKIDSVSSKLISGSAFESSFSFDEITRIPSPTEILERNTSPDSGVETIDVEPMEFTEPKTAVKAIKVIKDVLEQTSAQGSKFGTLESKVLHMVSMVAHWKPSTFHNVVRKSKFVEHQEMDETEDSDEVFEIDLESKMLTDVKVSMLDISSEPGLGCEAKAMVPDAVTSQIIPAPEMGNVDLDTGSCHLVSMVAHWIPITFASAVEVKNESKNGYLETGLSNSEEPVASIDDSTKKLVVIEDPASKKAEFRLDLDENVQIEQMAKWNSDWKA